MANDIVCGQFVKCKVRVWGDEYVFKWVKFSSIISVVPLTGLDSCGVITSNEQDRPYDCEMSAEKLLILIKTTGEEL